ncbi:MAG: hypothetical protein AB7K24_04755, partial [Gemmataceae bacterium]
MIAVTCPSCQRAYNLNDNLAGKRFKCVQCSAIVAVPGTATVAAPAAGAAPPTSTLPAPQNAPAAAPGAAAASSSSILLWSLFGWNMVLTVAAGVVYLMKT